MHDCLSICDANATLEYLTEQFCNHEEPKILEKPVLSFSDHPDSQPSPDEEIVTGDLPSTLRGPPMKCLVPPGQCQFGPLPLRVPLIQRIPVTETTAVLRFALPHRSHPLNLSTCACLYAHAEIDGQMVKRPYTPISTNIYVGSFDLLVKNYGPTAKMSRKLHELQPGDDSISFSHGPDNVKIQADDFIHGQYDHIGMLVGGTGITPMIQALHALLGNNGKREPRITLLYGSRTSGEILAKTLLHKWSKYYDQFTLVHVLSDEPAYSLWDDGVRGHITKELIEQYFPSAGSETRQKIFVCGPPGMYDALCGPREQSSVSGVLGDLGFLPEQVYKF